MRKVWDFAVWARTSCGSRVSPPPGCPPWGDRRRGPGPRSSAGRVAPVGGRGRSGPPRFCQGAEVWGGEVAATRQGDVDRLAATLLFAHWGTRKSSLRRTGPQTKHVDVTGAQGSPMGKLRTGIVPAPAVPRRDADVFTPLPSGRPRKKGIHQAVISPHRNPPSSRATAAATTLFTFLRAARVRNRAHRPRWAAQDRATVSGVHASWRRRRVGPTDGPCW